MKKNMHQAKYLIIGNSAGGIGAAEAIREVDKTGQITIVSDEPYPVYSRPLISEYLAQEHSVDSMSYRPADFYEKNNVRTVLGSKVKRIDTVGHVVELGDGRKIGWEKLLLATGGLPIVPRIDGLGRRGVFTFTTLDDAKAIAEFLKLPAQAVVIGGGLIGISVAEALVKRRVEVAIVEMKERILNTILDSEASALVAETISRAGVSIVTGHTVSSVIGSHSKEDALSGVTLDDGTRLACNFVVMAIGVRPRVELAAEAGLKINRGIVVDRHMTTSHPDIYACGDACEAYDFIYNDCRLTPIWPNAYMGGRVAGFNMAGTPAEYKRATVLNSLKYFGLDIATAGMVAPPDSGYEVLRKRHGNAYRMLVLKDGFLVGMVFVGGIEKAGIVFSLIKDRINVEDFKDALLSLDFSFTSLPERIWRERLAVPG